MSKIISVKSIKEIQIIARSLAIWSLGQMGFVIKGPETTIYIDPCLSDILHQDLGGWWKRAFPPPVAPKDITNADFYFISHEHLDHLDPLTVGPIAKASPNVQFVTSKWCEELLINQGIPKESVISLEALSPLILPGNDIRVTGIPSAHYGLDFDEKKGYRWIGFIIEWNDVVIYHAGDTIIYPNYINTLKQFPQINVAILPMNGRDYYRETEIGAIGNLLPVEAVKLATELNVDLLIPGHNDLYPNNKIPFSSIVDSIEKTSPDLNYKILNAGELLYYVAPKR